MCGQLPAVLAAAQRSSPWEQGLRTSSWALAASASACVVSASASCSPMRSPTRCAACLLCCPKPPTSPCLRRPLVTVIVIAPYARPLLNQVYAEGSPAQAAVTAPSSFLPFGHQLFVTLLLFRFIYGYTLRSARWSACRCWRSARWSVRAGAGIRDAQPQGFLARRVLSAVHPVLGAGFLVLSIAAVKAR